ARSARRAHPLAIASRPLPVASPSSPARPVTYLTCLLARRSVPCSSRRVPCPSRSLPVPSPARRVPCLSRRAARPVPCASRFVPCLSSRPLPVAPSPARRFSSPLPSTRPQSVASRPAVLSSRVLPAFRISAAAVSTSTLPLEFSVWLLRARHLLESQVQAHETLWAHASGDLLEPAHPAPLAADPTPVDSDRYARERVDVTVWKSRDAAACIALSSLLPESEETHFTQICTTSEFLTAIKARYATPTTVSLGRLFFPFLFPDLASFERTADLITHLRSLDSSYRATCTDAQLALLPPPMEITIYFIATSLPDRLASVRDALLLNHPTELTLEVFESALKDVESNLRSVASASGVVPPPLF
ncbi:unnamed protein product, partial [Closterium sp. NIES-54]